MKIIPLYIIRFKQGDHNCFLEKNLKISPKNLKTIKKDIFQKNTAVSQCVLRYLNGCNIIFYWMIPEVSTVQVVSLLSLISLNPFPSSGRDVEEEEEVAFWMVPLVFTR